MSNVRRSPLADKVHHATGLSVDACIQCGKCSAGCPMGRYMDILPNRIVRMVRMGRGEAAETLLRSSAIWNCVGCLTCTQRCPCKVDPAGVIDALREIAIEEGKVPDAARRVLAFYRSFIGSVESSGRMGEFDLVARYKLATLDVFSDVDVAPAMMARGKLHLTNPSIRGRDQVRRMIKRCVKEPAP